jgi:hypothetical protein
VHCDCSDEAVGYLIGQGYPEADLPTGWIPVQACDVCRRCEDDEDAAKAAGKAHDVPVAWFPSGTDGEGDWAIMLGDETTVQVSLGAGATYEIFHDMFGAVGGQRGWQQRSGGCGWNIALNGEDVHVLAVDDEGIRCEPALDDDFDQFGAPKFVKWENVNTVLIY